MLCINTGYVLKVAIFIRVKIIYKNQKTYFMKLVQTIIPAVGFCSKDHSWEILYKIKIGLDSEKYSTVLVSNCTYLQIFTVEKSYFKTLNLKVGLKYPLMQS